MARISLTEQYQNKDVITQIYELKDTVVGYDEKIETADQKASQASTDAQLSKQMAQEAIANTNTFDTRINNAVNNANDALTQVQTAQAGVNASLTDAEVRTTSTSAPLWQKQNNNVEKGTAIPMASATQAGLMNSQTYTSLTSMEARVSALEGKQSIVYVTFASDNPSQSEITAVFTSQASRSPVKGDIASDIARSLIYQYDGLQWIKTQSVAAQWTNDSAGLIKGTPAGGEAGTIFAETDGTGSVNGWDALSTKVDNTYAQVQNNTSNISVNANAIATANTKIQENTTAITTLSSQTTTSLNTKQATLRTATVVLTTGGWSSLTQTVSCSVVTAGNIVWVAPSDNIQAYGEAGVYASAQGTGTITFKCSETPTVAFTVAIVTADI